MQDTTPSPTKTYTVAEAAAIIGVDLATISRWLRPGKKQKLKAGWNGNERAIPAEQVDRLAAQRNVRTQAASVGQQLGTIARALFEVHQAQWRIEYRAACALLAETELENPAWSERARAVGATWERRHEHQAVHALSLALGREVRKLERQPDTVAVEPESREVVDA